MKTEDAIKVIEQALNVATKEGVYSLADANQILSALGVLHKLVEANSPTILSVE